MALLPSGHLLCAHREVDRNAPDLSRAAEEAGRLAGPLPKDDGKATFCGLGFESAATEERVEEARREDTSLDIIVTASNKET